jgi:serine/threonine protein kinase/Leucine-rich repeat (LRR) protein/Flp pilus assembly protein TadD
MEVGDELAGKKFKCPFCKTVVDVPQPGRGTDAAAFGGFEMTLPDSEQGKPGAKPTAAKGTAKPVTPPSTPSTPGPAPAREAEKPISEPTNDAKSEGDALDALLEEKRGKRPPFEVEQEIAHGGMGAVLLAQDKAIQRELAVKVMRRQIADSEEHRLRFLEEAQVTGQLEHPNIVPIHELGKDAEGNLYFTMKLVKGRSLGQILKEMKEAEGSGFGVQGSGRQPQAAEPDTSDAAHHRPLTTHHSPTLSAYGGLTLSDLLTIFLKACDGIAFAHSKSVIHRDLKPDNIMVGDFGEVLVMDWGLAKVLRDRGQGTRDEGPEEGMGVKKAPATQDSHAPPPACAPDGAGEPPHFSHSPPTTHHSPAAQSESAIRKADTVRSVRSESDVALTVDGQTMGTPAYMPPEQAEGKIDQIDHRSDIYSLGAILYEILTLERPVEGDTVHKVLLNVADGKITPPEQRTPGRRIPKELSAIVMKAMAKSRRKRYQSVPDLSQDIKLFLEGRSVSAKHDTFLEAFGKLVKRNKGVSAAVAIAAVLLVSVVSFSFIRITRALERAVRGEQEATAAQKKQRETALQASKDLASQAVRAAEEGRLAEADVRANAAVRVMPDSPWGHYALAVIARERKDLAAARRHLEKALKLDGSHAPSKAALSQLLAQQGDLAKVAELLNRIDEVTDWRTLGSAGEAFMSAGRYQDAAKAFERALVLMAKDATVQPQALAENKDRLSDARAEVACIGFYDSIRNLPTEEQEQRITAKLREIHGTDVTARFTVENGVVASAFLQCNRALRCLQPLRGLALTSLQIYETQVNDLSPLKGMQLTFLICAQTKVTDLSPLKGMPLRSLHCSATQVSDLSPLKGMPLASLDCAYTPVSDLSPLKGMPLTTLDCTATKVSDLSPLKAMPLTTLNVRGTPVSDLSALKGMPLAILDCSGNQVSDLSPLKGMPLTTLTCDGGDVSDLSPLKGMQLTTFSCHVSKVVDLSPLKGMPLTKLCCSATYVADLSPLRGMPLQELMVQNCLKLTDLTPLEGMKIQTLMFTPKNITKGIEVIRAMKSLNQILVDGATWMKPEEFWKKYDAGEFK